VTSPIVRLSTLDEERFGIRTARTSSVTLDNLPEILIFCREEYVSFLIARCPVDDLGAAQAMERAGFGLMDTLIYYRYDLHANPVPTTQKEIHVRPVAIGEEEIIKQVAAESFRGYFGHYHADPRLDRRQCDAVYVSWAYRSCVSRDVADELLVAEHEGDIRGFVTLKVMDSDEADGGLLAVTPSAQGTGFAQTLMVGALEWCQMRSLRRMLISTQITNLASQKVWVRIGFEPSHAYYTFHKWFD
jgi:GNAT superfamily N-acetyltransferase